MNRGEQVKEMVQRPVGGLWTGAAKVTTAEAQRTRPIVHSSFSGQLAFAPSAARYGIQRVTGGVSEPNQWSELGHKK